MRARILPFRRRGLPWSAAVLVALLGIAAWSPRTAGGEPRPDVVSTGLTLTPASARAGDPVTAVVTVRNQGTGPAGPSLVGLYLGTSSGSPLTSAIPLGAIAVGALAPGASQAVSRSFTVPGVAPGTFTVIAVVDGATTLLESSETNNRRTASLRVTLADLTVARVTLAPSHARTGDTVTATAVIRNGGQVPAQASAVRLLFEPGAGAPPAVVGSRSTEPLAAGESRELSFTFTVPSVPARRAYYVWAQVDADGGLLETNEGNNRNGTWLDVTIPDLTISGLSLRPAPARAGDPVSAIVVVRNSSPVPAGGTTLRLYFETAAGAPLDPAGDGDGRLAESRRVARDVAPVHGPGRAARPLVPRVGAGGRRGRPPRDQRGQQPPRHLAQRDHPGPHHQRVFRCGPRPPAPATRSRRPSSSGTAARSPPTPARCASTSRPPPAHPRPCWGRSRSGP